MADDPEPIRPVERPGPADISDADVIREVRRAAVWIGMALLVAGIIVLSQPILLIIGGMVFAVSSPRRRSGSASPCSSSGSSSSPSPCC